MKSEGIRTLVRKLRLCQSARGRKRTRVERLVLAPASEAWRTTFLRLFLGKRIGTFAKAYKPASAKKNLLRETKAVSHWQATRLPWGSGDAHACFFRRGISGST